MCCSQAARQAASQPARQTDSYWQAGRQAGGRAGRQAATGTGFICGCAPEELGASVDHRAQDFCCHDHAAGVGVERHIACSTQKGQHGGGPGGDVYSRSECAERAETVVRHRPRQNVCKMQHLQRLRNNAQQQGACKPMRTRHQPHIPESSACPPHMHLHIPTPPHQLFTQPHHPPVISPTSPNSSASSRYFWLLSALRGEV